MVNNGPFDQNNDEAMKTPSRITGAVAGGVAGSLVLGPLGALAGAAAGGLLGPKSKIVNNVSEKAMQKLGQWAGR